MEYTELNDYALPSGTTTTWVPHASDDAWRPDPRELSYDHEAHLRTAQDGAWIGSVLQVPLPFHAGAVRRTLRAWLARHEVLRTTVRHSGDPAGDGGWARETCAPDRVDVVAGEAEALSGEAALARVLSTFEQVGPLRWPHVLFATIEPDQAADDGFVLAFGADHSVMDAYSQLLWFEEIVRLYERALLGDTDHELAVLDVGSHVDFAAFDRRLGQLVSEHDSAVTAWGEFLSRGEGDAPAFPPYPDPVLASTGPEPGAAQQSLSVWVLDAAEAASINGWCRGIGTGLQAAALGTLGAAVREHTGTESVEVVLPMHTRHEPRYAGSVGWYVGMCPLTLDPPTDDDPVGLVLGAHAAVTRVKHVAHRPFARVAELLDVQSCPRFVVSYVDVRHVPGAEHWESWRARTLRSAAPDAGEVYLWVIRSSRGISLSARVPAGSAQRERMDALVEAYTRRLGDLARVTRTERDLPRASGA